MVTTLGQPSRPSGSPGRGLLLAEHPATTNARETTIITTDIDFFENMVLLLIGTLLTSSLSLP